MASLAFSVVMLTAAQIADGVRWHGPHPEKLDLPTVSAPPSETQQPETPWPAADRRQARTDAARQGTSDAFQAHATQPHRSSADR